jgi:glycosyltransferase 2 family protein
MKITTEFLHYMNKKRFYIVLKILISVAILYFIFQKIDIKVVIETFKQANVYFLILGLFIGYVFQIFIGGIRWYFSMNTIFKHNINFAKLLKIFWEGMFIGYFLPASIGWDIFRVMEGKKLDLPAYKNIIIIIWEKLFGLASTLFLFFVSFPFFKDELTDPVVYSLMNKLWYIVIVAAFSLILLLFVSNRLSPLKSFFTQIKLFVEVTFEKVFSKLFRKAIVNINRAMIYKYFISIVNQNGFVFFILSLIIKLLPALGTLIFFYAIGIYISFSVCVFATVVIIFIHMLPISFGSIGIREGAFIVVFGFFGVSPEEALIVSFFGLFSLIFTILLGGVSLLISNTNALLKRNKSEI